MLRMAKAEVVSLQVDPKPMDRATWQRIKVVVEHEACHRDWGCALYSLHRIGKIDNDQREAGDRFAALIRDHRKLWMDPMGQIQLYQTDDRLSWEKRTPAIADATWALGMVAGEALKEETEFEIKRAQRLSKRYKEARTIAGPACGILEDLLMDEVWPIGEGGHREIKHALTRLSHFFATGTKRERR